MLAQQDRQRAKCWLNTRSADGGINAAASFTPLKQQSAGRRWSGRRKVWIWQCGRLNNSRLNISLWFFSQCSDLWTDALVLGEVPRCFSVSCNLPKKFTESFKGLDKEKRLTQLHHPSWFKIKKTHHHNCFFVFLALSTGVTSPSRVMLVSFGLKGFPLLPTQRLTIMKLSLNDQI